MERSTICVNTSDRPSPLRVLLNSLMIQTCMNFDIIIVDDGKSPAFTLEEALCLQQTFKSLGVDCIYHKNTSRNGLSRSRNIGLDIMETGIGIFLDDDHICDSRFVEFLIATFDQKDNVGCVGALFPHVEGNIRYELEPPPVFGDILHDKEWGNWQRWYYPFTSNEDGIYPAIALGGIVAFRTDPKIQKDDRLSYVSHTEDTMFSFRYLEEGYNNYVNIRALAYHRLIGDGGCRTFQDADAQRDKDTNIFNDYLRHVKPIIELLKF